MSNDKKTNTIQGSRDDDDIFGTNRNDKILGYGGDDDLGGSRGGDRIFGGTGNDVLTGGAGDDWLKGDTGNDVLNGRGGSDRVDGGPGDDIAIYVLAENTHSEDDYDGGSGIDTLRLVFSGAEWARADVKADVARYLAFLASEINPSGQAKGHEFEFRGFDLAATKFEKLEVVVDGRVIDPRGTSIDAVDDAATVSQDGTVSGNVLANDLVSNLAAVALVLSPEHGALTFAANGTYTYVPGTGSNVLALGENAYDSFVYRVTDTSGITDTATVTFTITGTNDSPLAQADVAAGTENQQLAIDVLSNDADPDHGAMLHVTAASVPAGQGTVAINSDSTLQFDPGHDFDRLAVGQHATVNIAYTIADQYGASSSSNVAVTITGTNDAPVAQPDSYVAVEDTVLTGNVLANDTDPDGDTLSVVSVGRQVTGQGSVQINADGSFAYTPLHNYSGTDHFSYTVGDGHGGTSIVTVSLTVNAVADMPSLVVPENNMGFERGLAGWSTIGSVAVEQQHGAISPADQGWLAWVDASGASQAAIEKFAGLTPGALDTLAGGDAVNGGAMKAPLIVMAGDTVSFDWNFLALDSAPYNDFAFVVTGDGHAIRLADVATVGLGNATGWHTYSFTAPTSGQIDLAFGVMNVRDSATSSNLFVDDIRVNGERPYVPGTEQAPIPIGMSAALGDLDGSESLAVHISNLPPGAILSAGSDLGGGHWELTADQLQNLTLTTPHDYTGLFTVNVTATATESSNGDVATVSRHFSVMVSPANDAPVAVDDTAVTNENASTLIDVTANDVDANSDVLSLAALFGTKSAYGATLSIVDGEVRYDPSTSGALQALGQGLIVQDSIDYLVSDQRGGTSVGHVTVNVEGAGDHMEGVSLGYSYVDDSLSASPLYAEHVVAGASVEIGGLWGDASPGTLDLTDDSIIIDFQSAGTMSAAGFNGLHLTDYADALGSILDVTVAQSNVAGFDASRVTHDANSISVNLQGLAYDQGSHIELQVVF